MTTRFLFLPLALAFVLTACNNDAADDTEAASEIDRSIPVDVIVAEPGLFEDVIELTGSVDALHAVFTKDTEDATLGAETAGTLTYLAPLGSFVRAGGTIAQVDPALAQAQVASARAAVAQAEAGIRAARAQREAAQAQLDLAEDTYRRQEPLFRDSILSAWEFRGTETQRAAARAQVSQAEAGIAQAQGMLANAQAGLSQAQTALSNTRVTAPFSGTVESHLARRGEIVGPGSPISRFVSGGGLKVAAGVPERYAGDIEVGTPVRIRTTTHEGEPISGRVTFVGRAVNTDSRTFPIEATVADSEIPLRPAMVVSLEVSRAVLNDVIAVPLAAIVRDERGTSVFVVREDSAGLIAQRQAVELGPTAGGQVLIESGLESGDRVIAAGQTTVTEGDRVRIANTQTTPVTATALHD